MFFPNQLFLRQTSDVMINALFALGRLVRRRLLSSLFIGSLVAVTYLFLVSQLDGHTGHRRIALETSHQKADVDTLPRVISGKMHILEDDVVGNRTYYPMEQLRKEQQSRIRRLRLECAGRQNALFGISTGEWAYDRIEVDRRNNYMYCPLLKVGSTFFRRLFYAVRGGKQLHSPYEVPIQRALSARRDVLSSLFKLPEDTSAEFLANATSIMFVREPFSRLLSGYTDKLFAPNPYFWHEIGSHIVSEFRGRSVAPPAKMCAHDVTFAEFVRYVIHSEKTNRKRDAHFTPTYDQCKPCSLNYTVLGKMESFLPDVALTLDQLGHRLSKEKLKSWAQQATDDAILDSTYSPWGWRRSIQKCMTWEEALRRIWRKLQIRGIILLEDKFPFSPVGHHSRGLTLKVFTDAVRSVHSKADKGRLKQQKLELLAEAYSSVSEEDIAALSDIFTPDFNLFQYEQRPDFIYNKHFVDLVRDRNVVFNLSTT